MKKEELIIIVDNSQETFFALNELCEVCRASPEIIKAFIEYEIIRPQGASDDTWLFDLNHLQKVKMALRLQQDLEVNLAGIALVMDLLDELEELREKVKLLERHLNL